MHWTPLLIFAALQALDWYSTIRALKHPGVSEVGPIMAPLAKRIGMSAALAVTKALAIAIGAGLASIPLDLVAQTFFGTVHTGMVVYGMLCGLIGWYAATVVANYRN